MVAFGFVFKDGQEFPKAGRDILGGGNSMCRGGEAERSQLIRGAQDSAATTFRQVCGVG